MGANDPRVDFLPQCVDKHLVVCVEADRPVGRVATTQARLVKEEGVPTTTGAAAHMTA